ncbi:MAG: hypothetical protein JXX14_24390 [Deltaproteobacteria bacterium]|nr:hypothetical protein [Deltaproteobacteria bacterium]
MLNRIFQTGFLFGCIVMLLPMTANAKPGTHGRAISTWDTTRSSIALMYHRGIILEGGLANNLSYNVNFTSTSGKLGSQFGLQYMNLSPREPQDTLHGGSVSAVALYGVPMGKRYSNGLPKAALSFFFGAVPAVHTNGKYTFSTFPLVFGLGVELNPIRHLSITPWVEGAPSFNFDSVIRYDAFQNRINQGTIDDIQIDYGPNGEILDVSVDNAVVEDLLDDAIEYELAIAFRIRGGVSITGHIGDRLDVQVNASVVQMGNDFDAKPTVSFGGGLVWAWDDAPMGILPEEERASTLSCKAVEARYTQCGEYHTLVAKTREDERLMVEQECEKKIIVHEDDTNVNNSSDATGRSGGRPLSPTAVGVAASELHSATDTIMVPGAEPMTDPTPPETNEDNPAVTMDATTVSSETQIPEDIPTEVPSSFSTESPSSP